MRSTFSYFRGSFAFLAIGVGLGYWLAGPQVAYIVAVLGVLETSLSLDNAVVNAQILQNWDEKWRRAFLVYGLPVAVFGMRFVFPILIVTMTTGLGNIEVIQMAIYQPDDYAQALTAVHHQVAAFGGVFLLMVFLHFFVDANKDEHWLHWIESPLTKLGQVEAVEAAIALAVLLGVSHFLEEAKQSEFILAGVWGLIAYIVSKGLGSVLGDGDGAENHIVKQGIGGFLYLEMLDSSFSFDGVIGAFVLSNNLFVIATGLGIGAMFVRSLTIYLVDQGTLASLRYLEHGAFWAIGALAAIMLFGVEMHIPEAVTGLIGAVLIVAAGMHSWYANKQES